MRRYAALALVWCVAVTLAAPAPASAQSGGVVLGAVVDSATGAPVEGALVRQIGADGRSVITPPSGEFRLRLGAGPAVAVVTRIGFAPETLRVGDERVWVRLRPRALALSRVLVTEERALSAASSGAVRDVDIRLRPRESSLFFVGLRFQHRMTSALLGGVGEDASFIAGQVARRSGIVAAV